MQSFQESQASRASPVDCADGALISYQDPIVFFDGVGYKISIFRDGHIIQASFSQHTVDVCASNENEISTLDRIHIKGPVASDGILYYIHAYSHDINISEFIWLSSMEEAMAVNKSLSAAEKAFFDKD